jgi:glutaryl-CoA dehydrogenase
MNRATTSPVDFCGVDDSLTPEEQRVRDTAAEFVDRDVLPVIREHFDAHTFPREFVTGLAARRLLGCSLEGYGCAGLGPVAYGVVCRELERGDSGLRSFLSVQSSLCMYPIWRYGSDEQKQRFLPAMARGELIGCFGLSEAHGGSDPANMLTRAERRGSDWVLNGTKAWITNAPVADLAIVWAKTAEGVRGFIVERGMRGFTTPGIDRKYSLRASATGSLAFDGVLLPAANVLPGSTVGLRAPLSCLTHARFGIVWGVIGAAQACLREALDYTTERVMFGRPLAANQAVQLRLADMARRITTAQLLALQLGRLEQQGRLIPAQVSIAKWNNCRAAIDIARDCRDLLGAAGIRAEHVAMRHALNLESVITYEGTETIHQLSVGRELTGINAF